MKTVYLDIETIPSGKKPSPDEIKAPKNYKDPEKIKAYKESAVDKAWHDQGLDSMRGQILCIGAAVNNDEPQVFMNLDEFNDFIMAFPQDLEFVGHNIAQFDAKWLVRHGIARGYEYPARFKLDRYRGNLRDTMTIWACGDWKDHVKLDDLARFLGVGRKTEGIDGSKVWDFYKQGRIEEIKNYCADDVRLVREVYGKIKYLIKERFAA